jgi:hypothetical protein
MGTSLRVDDQWMRTVAVFKLIQTLDQLEERVRVLHLVPSNDTAPGGGRKRPGRKDGSGTGARR